MFGDGSLSFREFATREPLPLARIHDAVLEFLSHRDDAALCGAQAVNAYVDESRMTQDVDILSTRAEPLAKEPRKYLADRFHIETRVRPLAQGIGFRIYQLRQPKNRHLVDVRSVSAFPPTQRVAEVLVPTVDDIVAQKVISYCSRRGQPKSGTDWRDLTLLLLTYPQLKSESGAVMERLKANGADAQAIEEWRRLVASEIRPEQPDEY